MTLLEFSAECFANQCGECENPNCPCGCHGDENDEEEYE